MGLNYITLLGEVISSPEKKHNLEGIAITSFNISFNMNTDNIINKNSIKVSAINKLADRVAFEVELNDKIIIEGKLLTRVIENKNFKQKISYIQLSNFNLIQKNNSENIQEEIIENTNEDEIPF